jgi:hypothetical protein
MPFSKWIDDHFVPNWRESWRWMSVQSMWAYGATASVVVANADVLIALTGLLPESNWGRLVAALTVLTFTVIIPWAMRLWNQQERTDEQPDENQ